MKRIVTIGMILAMVFMVTPAVYSASERPNSAQELQDSYKQIVDSWDKDMNYELFQRITAEASFAHLNGKWYWGFLCTWYVSGMYFALQEIAADDNERAYYKNQAEKFSKLLFNYAARVDFNANQELFTKVGKYMERNLNKSAKKIRPFIVAAR